MSQNPKEECMNPLFPGDPSTCQFDPCQCAENWDAESAPCPVCGSEERNKSGILLCECPCPTTLGARRKIAEEMQAMNPKPDIAAVKKELRRQMELSLSQGPIFMSLEEVIALLDSHDKLEAEAQKIIAYMSGYEDECSGLPEALARIQDLNNRRVKYQQKVYDLEAENEALRANVAVLREGLKPFTRWGSCLGYVKDATLNYPAKGASLQEAYRLSVTLNPGQALLDELAKLKADYDQVLTTWAEIKAERDTLAAENARLECARWHTPPSDAEPAGVTWEEWCSNLSMQNARLKVELQEWIDNRDNLEMNYQGLAQVKQDVCRENARLRERLEAAEGAGQYVLERWTKMGKCIHDPIQWGTWIEEFLADYAKYANPQQSTDTGPVAAEKGGDNA